MNLADLKKFNKSGVVSKVIILPLGKEWVVECHMLNGKTENLEKARSEGMKAYKSIAGAISDIKNAGFEKTEVYFPR